MVINTCKISAQKNVTNEYLNLYTSKQFKEIANKYYTDISVFEDPTMSYFAEDKSHPVLKGKKQIQGFLEQGFAKISNIKYEIEKSYSAGSISFNYGILHYDYIAEKKDGTTKKIKFSLPLAITLKFKDGKVIHHQDIADYNAWLKQYNEQIK